MKIEAPEIDKRKFSELFNILKDRAVLYTPEWTITDADEKKAGVALLKIFAHMQEEIITRLNRVPDKNFTAFLEMLGIKLMPAQPAKAPVTFYLSEGLTEGAFVPVRAQAATEETEKHKALTFETINGFFATPAVIQEIYCVDPVRDKILRYSEDFKNKKEFTVFVGDKNLQEHVLYLGHNELFNVKSSVEIEISVSKADSKFGEAQFVNWQYWGESKATKKLDWYDLEVKVEQTSKIILTKKNNDVINELEINGIKSRWIRCKTLDIVKTNDIAIGSIKIGINCSEQQVSQSSKLPPMAVRGIGKIFGERLYQQKIITIENLLRFKDRLDELAKILSGEEKASEYYREQAENILENAQKGIMDEEYENIEEIGVATQGILPDMAFYNSFPLDLTTDFYPFGKQPRLFDTFYFASSEAFSKKNADITITILAHLEKDNPIPVDVQLSWEYWNGTVWRAITIKENTVGNFNLGINSGHIKFNCPEDLKEVEVNGEKNYWIRVRLINGNYGKEKFVPVYSGQIIDHYEIVPNFNPPIISAVNIQYSFGTNYEDLQHCLTYNNLEYRDFTEESKGSNGSFKPFIPLLEEKPALYLGFNNAFKKGNISLFFSLAEEKSPLFVRQKIGWTYWRKASNLIANITKETEIYLVSLEGINEGTELLFEESIGTEIITETAIVDSYFINENKITLDKELKHKYTTAARVFRRAYFEVSDNTGYLTKSGTLEFIGPAEQFKTHKFGKDSYWLMGTLIETGNIFESPLIKGIYPNTVWAEQIETIKDEILGSSDGEKNSKYKFNRLPVISQEIWIMEGETIHREEKETLAEEDIHEIKDEKGKVIETWVKWKAVEDFINSASRDRHYMIDNAMGEMQFGDGEKGMIPAIGKDNIKANYKSGGGVQGNAGKNEISALKSSVAGIDHVINHEPAEGGADTELLNEVFERGPHLIKHRDKAVTKEDFERLTKAASSYIARTKCFTEGANLNVIIIPKGEEDRPYPSLGLRNIVRKYLLERSLNTILNESLAVVEPSYKEVKVIIDVIPESIDLAVPLEKEILRQLKEYLHPLTGGNEKSGWEFGRGVHISDVYALLEGIDGVHHVENLLLNDKSEDVEIKEFETVCSGEHRITMKLGS